MARGASERSTGSRRHRGLVQALASVLLVVSAVANWVQREALDSEQLVDTTDDMLADEDVQQSLSIYAGAIGVR